MRADEPRYRTGRLVRLACAVLALLSAAALGLQATAPTARADGSSGLTVSWTGDTSSAAAYQPTRDPSSPHYSRMKNISVTVDQTTNLIDQAVRVKISGFSPTQSASDFAGRLINNASNFFQAMQCWGDPSSATFYENCQWGGLFGPNAGVGSLVESNTLIRVAQTDLRGATSDPAGDAKDVPFRSIDGTLTSGRQLLTDTKAGTVTSYPLFSLFSPTNTNEVPGVRINSDGTGSFAFETQNSDSNPNLGCGTAGHLRCYLVLVPRDDVWGGDKPGKTGTCADDMVTNSGDLPAYGSTGVPQSGSPVNPACDYWDNRMVVPLDFTPTGATCPVGATERRTVGTDLLVSAMASWQLGLCDSTKTNYSFDTNPDALSRSQLVEGTVGLAFTPGPVLASQLSDTDAATLQNTAVSYAPVAATSTVIAYTADGRDGQIESLNLTPRLVAKLLTQSYTFSVPFEITGGAAELAHLPAVNRSYAYWNQDPDFQAANPNWADFVSNPAVVLPGPYSDDVIAQLWKWIVADPDARAFLNGAADPWGMQVNPYYRALGDPLATVPVYDSTGQLETSNGVTVTKAVGLSNLDGTPRKLGDSPLDSFIKADDTLVPFNLDAANVRYAFGSIQSSPYAQDFLSASKTTFHANPGAKTSWDSTVVDAAGDTGAWVSTGPQTVGQRFTLAFTDAASAQQFDLTTAQLSIPGKPTVFTTASDEQVAAALASNAMTASSTAAVSQLDPAKVTAGQYPLATLVYAAVNLTTTDAAARSDFAKLISTVTTTGQLPGSAVGQLPKGYVPLPASLVAQSAAAATAIASYVAPDSDDGSDSSTSDLGSAAGSGSASGGSATASGGSSAKVSAAGTATGRLTPAAATAPALQWFLIVALGFGVLGALASPLLFRRRRLD